MNVNRQQTRRTTEPAAGTPAGATGGGQLLGAYKQVMGAAGNYQTPGAKRAVALNIGGSATTNVVFIVGV